MKVMAVDFESSIGKTVHGSTFRDPENDIYTQIWATHPDYVNVLHNLEGFNRALAPTISDVDIIVGHNVSFDLCYVWNNNKVREWVIQGGKIWDTQIVEYILTGQQHTTSSLSELQAKYLGEVEKPSRITRLYKKGIGADKILASETRCPRLAKLYDRYCETDGSTPLKIFKAQYMRAKEQNMLAIVELYNDYLLAIINKTVTGVHIDVVGAERLLQDFMLKHTTYLKEAQEVLSSVWTDPRLPEFNINSPDHKSAVLFGGSIKVNVKVDAGFYKNGNHKTKTEEVFIEVKGFGISKQLSRPAKKQGLFSTDDKVLSAIKLAKNTPKEVLEYCRLQELSMKYKKAGNTYCKAFIERSVDGKLYPNFNSTVTPTGRLSSSKPNMQNLPSKGDLSEGIMGLVVAPKGWTCVSIDFSQLEKWVQALVSKDPTLIEALEQGVCMHCKTLARLENKDYSWVYQKAKVEGDPVWDKKRTNIKPVGFQMDYGAMPKSVSLATGMPLEEVEEIYKIDKELYPEKHRFFEETLPRAVMVSAKFSLACNIPKNKLKGKDGAKILGKAELLPIFDKSGELSYNKQELRYTGYWSTSYGKKYHFVDTGRINKWGQFKRSFAMPKFKNYPNQGGAADIQAATSAELLQTIIKKRDKIRMVNEVHDSKWFYVRTDVLHSCLVWLKETIEDVPAIFKRRFGVDVPFRFPVEIEVGDDFGKMKVYKL